MTCGEHNEWPADISGPAARNYERAILEQLRSALLPSTGAMITLQEINLVDERPDTKLVFVWTQSESPGETHAGAIPLWQRGYPTEGRFPPDGPLIPVSEVVATLITDWLAGDLDAVS